MGNKYKRKVVGIGESKGIVLPKPWLSFLGDISTVTLFIDDVLIVAPPGLEWKAKKMLEAAGKIRR